MNGLRIYYGGDTYLQSPEKDERYHPWFLTIFRDIIGDLASYYWIFPENPLSSTPAKDQEEMDYFYNVLCAKPFPNILPPYTFFPEYAKWIRNDWNDLFGFVKEADAYWFSRFSQDHYADFEHVDIYFHNTDAAFWECFTNNDQLLQKSLQSGRKVVSERHIRLFDLQQYFNERDGIRSS